MKLVARMLTTDEEATRNPASEKMWLLKTEFEIVNVVDAALRKTTFEVS